MMKNIPNYHRIYNDIINKKFPHLKDEYKSVLNNENLSVLDVIEINKKIFGVSVNDSENFNQKYRSYKRSDIFRILDYQNKHKLNNSQLAKHFKLSRNTVAKWKKLFPVLKK